MSSESLLGAEAESAASANVLTPPLNANASLVKDMEGMGFGFDVAVAAAKRSSSLEAAVQWTEQHAGSGGDGEETKKSVRSGGGVGGKGGSSGGRGFGGDPAEEEELFEQETSRWQKMHDPDNQRGNNVIYIWVHNIAKVRVHLDRVHLDRVHLDRVHLDRELRYKIDVR